MLIGRSGLFKNAYQNWRQLVAVAQTKDELLKEIDVNFEKLLHILSAGRPAMYHPGTAPLSGSEQISFEHLNNVHLC